MFLSKQNHSFTDEEVAVVVVEDSEVDREALVDTVDDGHDLVQDQEVVVLKNQSFAIRNFDLVYPKKSPRNSIKRDHRSENKMNRRMAVEVEAQVVVEVRLTTRRRSSF